MKRPGPRQKRIVSIRPAPSENQPRDYLPNGSDIARDFGLLAPSRSSNLSAERTLSRGARKGPPDLVIRCPADGGRLILSVSPEGLIQLDIEDPRGGLAYSVLDRLQTWRLMKALERRLDAA